MLEFDNLKKGLQSFANNIVVDAKANLQRKDKVVSGELYNSIKATGVVLSKNSLEIGVLMADYGGFIDKGVSGTETKYNTKYSYTNKMPPPSAFDGWSVRRGIAPRNEKGQFLTRKSLQFAIAMSVFKHGIKPSNFLTEAVQKNIPLLPESINKRFGLDVKNAVDFIIKTNKKK
tara:strand:- start:60 stop:581 length:522 start_codon:yes stop_codon:yes gene_type:complete